MKAVFFTGNDGNEHIRAELIQRASKAGMLTILQDEADIFVGFGTQHDTLMAAMSAHMDGKTVYILPEAGEPMPEPKWKQASQTDDTWKHVYEYTDTDPRIPTVVNLNKAEYDIYIGRAGMGHDGTFGNPFKIEQYGRDGAIREYREWILGRKHWDFKQRERRDILDQLAGLEGKRLGCFCKPKTCHGDVLVEIFRKRILREISKNQICTK